MATTKQDLIKSLEASQADATATQIALNDVLNNGVEWFRKGAHQLGIVRPTGAHGGIVIHRFRGEGNAKWYSIASYWERFLPPFKTAHSSDCKDLLDLRELVFKAETYVLRMQSTCYPNGQSLEQLTQGKAS